MTSDQQIAVADEIRAKLLALSEEDRHTVLWLLDFCRDCGRDVRGPHGVIDTRRCTCMRDE